MIVTTKPTLWLLISDMARSDIPLIVPTLAWMAQTRGAAFECYLEAPRDGRLFARTGSTVLGGAHHQQFNYLHAAFDVRAILLSETQVFTSSLAVFNTPILAESHSPVELYRALIQQFNITPQSVIFAPDGKVKAGERELAIAPYLYPDIYFGRALALPASLIEEALPLVREFDNAKRRALFLDEAQSNGYEIIDRLKEDDTYASITRRIAARWKHEARGVAFGDPAAILSQIAAHCREKRLALFGERQALHPSQVVAAAYTEQVSEAAGDVAQLARELNRPIIVGRQTGDGDIFEWSKSGLCIQIADPNRPPFPVVETVPHVWTARGDIYADEPDDETLRGYAHSGKILATLLWHSGEMAHNEAMLNLFEIATLTGIKMGIGVHAARYETAPQLWELMNVPRARGGVCGLIEPLLHSGGLGVLAEVNCPSGVLVHHCAAALARIRRLAGERATPRGYYAFMDSDLATLSTMQPHIFEVVAQSGLEYFVSSAQPGRNRILHQSGNFVVLNQTPRVIHGASPFVRITTAEDLETAPKLRPGWMIGTLDAPVIAFNPYIWRHGTRFMQLVDKVLRSSVNVLPHTIARYARILREEGFLPPVSTEP